MPAFQDLEGRQWTLRITYGTIRRVREQFDGLNLCDLADEQSGVFARLCNDLELFVNLLFFLVAEQADKAGITDEAFGEALAGDVLLEARNAFLEALADFFPNPKQREALRRAIAKGLELENLLIERGLLELENIDLAKLASGSTGSAGNSPASSA